MASMKQQELPFIPGGKAKWWGHFGILAVLCKTKHTLTVIIQQSFSLVFIQMN